MLFHTEKVHPKGNQSWIFIGRTDAEAEIPIIWLHDVKSCLIWKDPDAGKDWRQEEKGMTEDEMVGWHYGLNGHGFVWTPGVGDGQGGLACCSPWGCKRVRHNWATELNWTVCTLSRFSYVWLIVTLWTVAWQAPLSVEFSRQEYWTGLPCPTPGDLPDPGTKFASLCLLHWQAGSLPLEPPRKSLFI